MTPITSALSRHCPHTRGRNVCTRMNVPLRNRNSLRVSVGSVVVDSLAGIARFYSEVRYLGTISACIIGIAVVLTMHLLARNLSPA